MEPVYEVVWPLGKSVHDSLSLPPPPDNLKGKTVCELWDWLFRGDDVFRIIRELLAKRYPGIKFVDYSIFGSTGGARQREIIARLPELLRQHGCDVVISGVGA